MKDLITEGVTSVLLSASWFGADAKAGHVSPSSTLLRLFESGDW